MEYYDRPCASKGLISYRIRGRFGWIMIGATDHEDAYREALRSMTITDGISKKDLQVWNGECYENIT